MKTIVLISCSSEKESTATTAEQLYTSSLFKKSLARAKKLNPDAIYILSGKHHLLPLDKVIEPYNQRVSHKKDENEAWGAKVIDQLKKVTDLQNDKFIIYAGKDYVTPIKSSLKNVILPFDGVKGNGEMLQRLNQEEEKEWEAEQKLMGAELQKISNRIGSLSSTNVTNETYVSILHDIFNVLRRFYYPYQKKRGKNWIVPRNGIYVFFEKGEEYTNPQGYLQDRIVRIGIHTKDSEGGNRLFSRLDQHFRGNMNASSFRKYVGDSLQNKQKQPITDIEKEVSTYMRENFSFVVFEVETEEERKKWEKKLISTLGQAGKKGIIESSKNWLGRNSSNTNVKTSGLWQDDDMNGISLNLKELEQLLQIIQNSNLKYKL
ncbi:DUF6884 domain-containing protein [Capnocytophaga leadbetteri]|jgi:hypothetical protein|uniref:DUF6884 domain-containing protein n=1 Tax=Capnocytophaga leadbetteri TaxID=327575 RepID=UPI002889FA5A|nr:DUF6884 domain-containing protein [Capnocytophaga leadbetteri]